MTSTNTLADYFTVGGVILVNVISIVLLGLYLDENMRLKIFGITTIRGLSGISDIVRGNSGGCAHLDDDKRSGHCKNFNRCASRTYALNESKGDHFKNENFEPVYNCVYSGKDVDVQALILRKQNAQAQGSDSANDKFRCGNSIDEIKQVLKLGTITGKTESQDLSYSQDPEKVDPYFKKGTIADKNPELTLNGYFYNLYFHQLLSSINYKLQIEEAYTTLQDQNNAIQKTFGQFWEEKLMSTENILELIDPLFGKNWTFRYHIKSRSEIAEIECKYVSSINNNDSILYSLISSLSDNNKLKNDFETNGVAFSYDNFLTLILQDSLCTNLQLPEIPV